MNRNYQVASSLICMLEDSISRYLPKRTLRLMKSLYPTLPSVVIVLVLHLPAILHQIDLGR